MKKLIAGDWEGFKIPNWLKENHAYIVSNLHLLEILEKYSINHDCGKHLVKQVNDGKIQYPGHEESSCNYWLEHFPKEDLVGWLILNDMFFHTCSAVELDNTKLEVRDLCSLLLTSLAEIHANAKLFGGIESQSFKSKYKQLDRRGNKLCKKLFSRPDNNYGHVYVFCRKNLTSSQQAVQAGHALLELANKVDMQYHPSSVFVVVKSEEKLKMIIKELIDNDINFSMFREPNLNNEITSVATEPLFDDKRDLLKRFQLL